MNSMFYFLLALTAILATTANAGKPILDSKGNIITDGSYYVKKSPVSDFDTVGGGLTLADRGGNQCPLYVGQENSIFNMGIPVKFSDWKSSDEFVPESENLNIEMETNVTICSQSDYWRITPAAVVPARLFIKAGPKPSYGLFQIKKGDRYINRYQIFFCPDGYDCTRVGIFYDRDGGRLALNTSSYEVVFLKATKPETSSKSII